jgi:(p)ppGpp synthase/HD superfamily hydrolase
MATSASMNSLGASRRFRGRQSMQAQGNRGSGLGGREEESLSRTGPLARSVEHRRRVAELVDGQKVDRRRVLARTIEELRSLTWLPNPRIRFVGRIKSIASISNKMSTKGLGAHLILDIIGVRAITRRKRDCYHLVNLIHRKFESMDPEYDDYILDPKANGYRSIHTTVISPCGYPVEIQVRTQWMDALAQRGPAAHSRYKTRRIGKMP